MRWFNLGSQSIAIAGLARVDEVREVLGHGQDVLWGAMEDLNKPTICDDNGPLAIYLKSQP
jgi:hypothetical protein